MYRPIVALGRKFPRRNLKFKCLIAMLAMHLFILIAAINIMISDVSAVRGWGYKRPWVIAGSPLRPIHRHGCVGLAKTSFGRPTDRGGSDGGIWIT